MSTAPEAGPEPAEATPPTKPPMYRRPVVLIAAGVVLFLVVAGGGILLGLTLHGTPKTSHLAGASTSAPTSSKPAVAPAAGRTATATPTPAPAPAPSIPQPAPIAPANPPAAGVAAPVAPAPAPPVSSGLGRGSAAPKVLSFTGVQKAICPAPATYDDTVPVLLTWSSSGGTSWRITDGEPDLNFAAQASGTLTVNQYCRAEDGIAEYFFDVSTGTGVATKKASAAITVVLN